MKGLQLINFKNWNRIMLKLSGEVLIGKQDYGIDPDKVISIAEDIYRVHKKKKKICIIKGDGKIYKGI